MRLAWATDLHLDLAADAVFHALCKTLRKKRLNAVLISGDTAEAPALQANLLKLREQIGGIPIYFVLGNHDYYHGGVQEVRDQITALCRATPNLHWLSMEGIVALTDTTALLGHDGWADGRLGDWDASRVLLNDYTLIRDFKCLRKVERLVVMQRLAAEAAEHVRTCLPLALERFQSVIFLTHVPPFAEACWHEGRISNADYLPHFSSRTIGEALIESARAFPNRRITVLCGHTHGGGKAQVSTNIEILTGAAEYGAPDVQQVLDVE
jgi:predicted MPP superfamily phosphohydrolase